MRICGLNKTTLLDYPGKVAATIFLGGCNFRCPFCQNGSLVLHPETQPALSREEVLQFLKKRSGILEGVCVTGGEPSLSPELPDLLRSIRETGLSIKLDTNGSRPDVLKKLLEAHLVDKIAMDIKAAPDNYAVLCGLPHPDLVKILESAQLLMESNVDYEFRTTVVKELHTKEDFLSIKKWLSGAKAFYLQAYRESEDVLQPGFSSYSAEELTVFRDILRETIPLVEIRGID